jgi:hypothetical protein
VVRRVHLGKIGVELLTSGRRQSAGTVIGSRASEVVDGLALPLHILLSQNDRAQPVGNVTLVGVDLQA